MAADKIIRNSKLDTFLSKLATKLTAIFWRKAETTQVSIDDTPTANSNNLVKSGGVKSYVDSAIPTVPTALSQLSDDSTHRLVTDTEKSTWNGKQNALTFDSTPTANSTNPVTSGGVYSFVGNPIVSMTVPTPNDGTVIFNHRNGDTTILDLNHTHPQYLKYQLCTDEAEYQAIQNKESDKLYGIPEA